MTDNIVDIRINFDFDSDIQEVFKDYADLNLSLTDVNKIMLYLENDYPSFWRNEYESAKDSGPAFSDTLVRDYLFEGFVSVFMPDYDHWPMYCEDGDLFFEDFNKLKEKNNW